MRLLALPLLVACTSGDRVALDGSDSPTDTAEPGLDAPPAALVVMDAWEQTELPDPLEDHRPDGAECGLGSWGLEGSTLEVETGACDFLSVRQPLLTTIREGETLELVFWHAWLTAEDPAQGHLALFVGDALLWETWIDIPGDPASYTEVFRSPLGAVSGESVTLHLHNHGANTWNVLRLERVAVEAQ